VREQKGTRLWTLWWPWDLGKKIPVPNSKMGLTLRLYYSWYYSYVPRFLGLLTMATQKKISSRMKGRGWIQWLLSANALYSHHYLLLLVGVWRILSLVYSSTTHKTYMDQPLTSTPTLPL
jgi:hypothetical protein